MPQGQYSAVAVHRDIAYTAGMTPRHNGTLIASGKVGAELDIEQAAQAAGVAAANALAAVAAAAGGPEIIERVLAMTVWIAAAEGFTQHSAVADGATTRLGELVDAAPPARAAIGVSSLPGNAPVEISLVVALRDATSPTAAGHGTAKEGQHERGSGARVTPVLVPGRTGFPRQTATDTSSLSEDSDSRGKPQPAVELRAGAAACPATPSSLARRWPCAR